MDDGGGGRRLLSKGVDVCHDIVSKSGFVGSRALKIDVFKHLLDFGDGRVAHGKAEIALGRGKRVPDSSPRGEFPLLREDLPHFLRSIARLERRSIALVG